MRFYLHETILGKDFRIRVTMPESWQFPAKADTLAQLATQVLVEVKHLGEPDSAYHDITCFCHTLGITQNITRRLFGTHYCN
ncbi:hypothetical protein V6R21_30590 [Limibacter armeniacum]|uniref:hypothetical protein n=1 Tax=Limibacter armeniacum TaxID=466084 RepID=UPI002FE5EE40